MFRDIKKESSHLPFPTLSFSVLEKRIIFWTISMAPVLCMPKIIDTKVRVLLLREIIWNCRSDYWYLPFLSMVSSLVEDSPDTLRRPVKLPKASAVYHSAVAYFSSFFRNPSSLPSRLWWWVKPLSSCHTLGRLTKFLPPGFNLVQAIVSIGEWIRGGELSLLSLPLIDTLNYGIAKAEQF